MTTTDDMATAKAGGVAADAFEACLSSMSTALSAVVDEPAWTLAEEVVQNRFREVLRIRAQVEELTSRLLGSLVEREVPLLAGASSTRAWLMATHGLSVQDSSRLVSEAHLHAGTTDMAELRTEATRASWAEGRITAEQAVLIGATVDKLVLSTPAMVTRQLEDDLAGYARRLSYRELQRVCRHAFEVVDPDAADAVLAAQLESEVERARRNCELSFRRSGDGWTGFRGRLPDAQADMWRTALESMTSPRHERAVAATAGDAVRGQGSSVVDGSERSSYPQRLGQAWCELVEHLPTQRLPQQGSNSTTLMVSVTLDQLTGGMGEVMLASGTVMSPGQCRRLACNAAIIPVVLGGESVVLDLGMSRRLFDRYQRAALAVRDRGCIWAGCDRPPEWCEAHHIRSWSDGGPTDLANGCLLCPFHHHLIHSTAGWQVRMASDGLPDTIPPPRIDALGEPRRHERFGRRRL